MKLVKVTGNVIISQQVKFPTVIHPDNDKGYIKYDGIPAGKITKCDQSLTTILSEYQLVCVSQLVKLPNVIDLVQGLKATRNMSGSQMVKLPNVIDLLYCLNATRNMSGSQMVKLPNVTSP